MSNEAKAIEAKNRGNAAFQNGNFVEAIKHFTEAISYDPNNHVLYSNRSGAYASNNQLKEAKEDAIKTVQLKPDWGKGYSRLGYAHFALGEYQEALNTYSKGLQIEPSNPQLLKGLEDVKAAVKPIGLDMFASLFQGDIWTKIALNPSLSNFSKQPDFVTIVNEIQSNPQNISKYLNDPRVKELLTFLINQQLVNEQSRYKPSPPPEEKKQEKPKEEKPKQTPKEELSPEKKRATELKDQANELYKKKDFVAALSLYDQALQLDPDNLTLKLNKSAVYFEQGDFDKSHNECQEILSLREKDVVVPSQILAKAYFRIGNIHMKQKDYGKAVDSYGKAVVEERNPTYVKALDQAKKQKKQQDDLDYINPEISLQEKEKGNMFFKQNEFPEAIKAYTEAIKRNPNDHTLYSNRAAAYNKLGEYNLVIKDCDQCLALKPDFIKAYIRKGNVQFQLKQFGAALETFEKGLKLEQHNTELQEGVQKVFLAMQQGDPEAAQRDPEVQQILADPVMRQLLSEMAENPKALQEHIKNPEIAAKLFKLKAAGIIG